MDASDGRGRREGVTGGGGIGALAGAGVRARALATLKMVCVWGVFVYKGDF